ncbi:MAG: DNA (cytosine-5-)-methyltransferase [Nostoc sp.]|uniref:DNA cytosine methyltransferase n=1 Tax=Nostoc sp. TaxID=1180 RepID=UPI002FFB4509
MTNLKNTQNSQTTVISLFSGCGGIDLGFQRQGLSILWAIDNDLDCVETYKKNIGNHIINRSICDVHSREIPDADIIVGGFPCQGFSVANKFRSKDDVRNELYHEMLRVIQDKKPKWFMAENVKGILSLDDGLVFQKILEELQEVGYYVTYELVNMADHGVPQIRKRVIILGTRNDLPTEARVKHPLPDYSEKDKNIKKWITINSALEKLEKLKPTTNLVGSQYKVSYRNYTGHRQTNGDKPCPTIIARGNGKGGVCAIPHPNGIRRLNVRESAFIQTFPSDFEFTGSITSMYRQIGNAVPVLYSEKIAQEFIEANDRLKTFIEKQDRETKKINIVSLFSGAGGMDLGFKKVGFDIVWAIDNFEDAVQTYRKNIGNHIINSNIEDYNLNEIPDCDVLIGGFPCQGFSIANMKRSIHDNRNILYEYLVKVIQIKKPKIFIAENVKGILSLDEGKVFKNILEDFNKCGYKCKYAILNAAGYGVPQTRERVIILGQREDITIEIDFPPQPSDFKSYISVGQALSNFPDPDKKHNLKNHVYSKFKLKFNGYISNRRINPDLPCPTITARGDHKGGAMVMHHPSNKRRLTCREMAYIQGFPLDFEFIGSMTSVYRQIANALPCPVAEAVASSVYKALTNNCLNC